MTRVCVRCGWFVFDRERCARDGGPAISVKAAAKACGAANLFTLLHISPGVRLQHFRSHRRKAAT